MSDYGAHPSPHPSPQCGVVEGISDATEKYFAGLAELGIIVKPARGEVEFDTPRRMKIGHVVRVVGGYEIWPREGTTVFQLAAMAQHAQHALLAGPDESRGWHEVAGVGWSVAIFEPVGTGLAARARKLRRVGPGAAQHFVVLD
ncbi:hypothetical protein ACFXG4_08615 [Nocardia sp. NPDC059246]|uniref:hypothetical protein n=1 Tax=unclassified Nocardia TaxID=2637762 RepID=UPI0036A6BE4C